MRVRMLAGPIAAALLLGCGGTGSYQQAICVLVDVSGTYADQKQEAVRILKREVLPNLVPGDTLAVIRIDGASYQRENVELLLTLDARPSRANAQKLAAARQLDAFGRTRHEAKHTDIAGAMMLAAEYLREVPARSRVLLVLSDLEEDLPRGAQRHVSPTEFEGIQVVAMNVKRLGKDASNPSGYRERLATWERRVVDSASLGWRTLMDPAKLPTYLTEVRESAPAPARSPAA